MSSLKYIFVIQGNSLVRVPVENHEESPKEKAPISEEGIAAGEGIEALIPATKPSKPSAKSRNKRN